MSEKLRIIVLGYIVRGPIGGMTWHHLQYVLGLAKLGHEVWFIEDSDDYPSCYDPTRHVTDTDPSYGLEYAARVFRRSRFAGEWAYYDAHRSTWLGPGTAAIGACRTADVVLNLSGMNPLRPWLAEVQRRAYVDTDPCFDQVRYLTDPGRRALVDGHNVFLSFGENLEANTSRIPETGLRWRATRQPVVLDAWPVTAGPETGRFATVMNWDSYEAREHAGVRYGMKSVSFNDYEDVPARVAGLEIALGSPGAPRERLAAKGWRIVDSLAVTRDPWTYQDYIRGCKAEWSVAKQGYVVSRSAWFSERSAGYLASGRPVVTQDTGYADVLPTGEGLLAFADPGEAVAAIEEVNARYALHCRRARELAHEFFDSDKVLGRLLDIVMERP